MSDREQEDHQQEQEQGSGGRKVAEWITMGLSILIVLGVAAYLTWMAVGSDTPFARVEATVLLDQTRQEGDQYIVPVEVRNHGRRTVHALRGAVTWGPGDAGHQREFRIDYLGENGSQRLYFIFEQPPQSLGLRAAAWQYQLD